MRHLDKSIINSKTVEVRQHDKTFKEYISERSKGRLSKYPDKSKVGTEELGERVGIGYEMFRKILNMTKPNQPRDCIIAICAALFLSEAETNQALFYYDDMPKLDDTEGGREYFIIQALRGNSERLKQEGLDYLDKAVEMINNTLESNGFGKLRLSNRANRKKEAFEKPRWKIKTTVDMTSEKFGYMDSLAYHYHPSKLDIIARLLAESDKGECFILHYRGVNHSILIEEGTFLPRDLEADERSRYSLLLEQLKDSYLLEQQSCYAILNDTKNYGSRLSARLRSKKLLLFGEYFNSIFPERQEYFYGELSQGRYTFFVYPKSHFMRSYLSQEDFKTYYPFLSPKIERKKFTTIEEIKAYSRRTWASWEVESSYSYYFKKLRQDLENLRQRLIEGKEVIRDYDSSSMADNPGEIYNYYGVLNEFDCKYRTCKTKVFEEGMPDLFLDKYGPMPDAVSVGTFLAYQSESWYQAEKESASFLCDGMTIDLTEQDLIDGFKLGLSRVEDICQLKKIYNQLADVYKD